MPNRKGASSLFGTSVVCRHAGATAARLRLAAAGWRDRFRRPAAVQGDDRWETAATAALCNESVLIRAMERPLDAVAPLWLASQAGSAIGDVLGQVMVLALWQRIRLTGILLLAATATASAIAILERAFPNRVAATVWFSVLLTAVTLIVSSRPLADAWRDRIAPRSE